MVLHVAPLASAPPAQRYRHILGVRWLEQVETDVEIRAVHFSHPVVHGYDGWVRFLFTVCLCPPIDWPLT